MSDEFYQTSADKFIFSVKKGLLYTENDAWARIEGEVVRVGVTDFFQRRGGDIVYVELPKVGIKVKRLEEVVQFETIKAVLTVTSPFEGTIVEANSLLEKPEVINEDPYGNGWLVIISPSNFKEDSRYLLTAERYFELMKLKIKEELKNK